jgi:hypothetical protein
MPSTASEPEEVTAEESDGPGQVPIPIYRFAFSWEGPYGHAVHLVERHARAGVVLDLGCGYAAVGEVLRDAGWEYVGGDRDTDAVADVVSRGLEGHVIDLAMSDGLADKLVELLGGRPVGAVILLDIIEHLPDPSALLGALTELSALLAADGRHAPVLVTSIPNVAHFDLAAKLVGGRWDVTPSGLLDRTHLQMFTERRIDAEFGRFGWQECGRDDVVLEHSDQWFPLDHPFLVEGGPVHDYLQSLRAAADDNMTINQFVRAYRRVPSWSPSDRHSPLPVPESATARGPAIDHPFLSVLTRSQGTRPSMLAEALTCLAAQTLEDIEVVVLVPGDDPGALQSSEAVVRSFEEGFVARVRVEQVTSDSRSATLNAGLELAHGRYVAFLDEGDLVTGDWAQRFAEGAEGAPGKLVRSVCDVRHVRRPAPEEEAMGAVPVTLTKPLAEFGERFDAISHLAVNTTPLSSVALPRSLVTEFHLRFDEQLAVGEDWDFLVRAALVVGVEDTGHVTSIHQRWTDEAAAMPVPSEAWEAAHAKMLSSLDAAPLLLPPGSATELAFLAGDASLARKHEAQRAELERALNEARVALAEAQETLRFRLRDESAQTESLLLQIEQLQRRARLAERAREEVLASEFWRVTAPLRALVTLIRGDRRDAGS